MTRFNNGNDVQSDDSSPSNHTFEGSRSSGRNTLGKDYYTDSQYQYGSMPVAEGEIIPLYRPRETFENTSNINTELSHDAAEFDEEFIVVNTQAISQMVHDLEHDDDDDNQKKSFEVILTDNNLRRKSYEEPMKDESQLQYCVVTTQEIHKMVSEETQVLDRHNIIQPRAPIGKSKSNMLPVAMARESAVTIHTWDMNEDYDDDESDRSDCIVPTQVLPSDLMSGRYSDGHISKYQNIDNTLEDCDKMSDTSDATVRSTYTLVDNLEDKNETKNLSSIDPEDTQLSASNYFKKNEAEKIDHVDVDESIKKVNIGQIAIDIYNPYNTDESEEGVTNRYEDKSNYDYDISVHKNEKIMESRSHEDPLIARKESLNTTTGIAIQESICLNISSSTELDGTCSYQQGSDDGKPNDLNGIENQDLNDREITSQPSQTDMPFTQNTSMILSALVHLSKSHQNISDESKSKYNHVTVVNENRKLSDEIQKQQKDIDEVAVAHDKTVPARKFVTNITSYVPDSALLNPQSVSPITERKYQRKFVTPNQTKPISSLKDNLHDNPYLDDLKPDHEPENEQSDWDTESFSYDKPMTKLRKNKGMVQQKFEKSLPKAIVNSNIELNDTSLSEEIEWNSQSTFSFVDRSETLKRLMRGKKKDDNMEDANKGNRDSDLNDYDLPKTWKKYQVKGMTFKIVWSYLKTLGWECKKGKELISYYYIRPGKTITLPHQPDIDYFTSEESLLIYVRMAYGIDAFSPKRSSGGGQTREVDDDDSKRTRYQGMKNTSIYDDKNEHLKGDQNGSETSVTIKSSTKAKRYQVKSEMATNSDEKGLSINQTSKVTITVDNYSHKKQKRTKSNHEESRSKKRSKDDYQQENSDDDRSTGSDIDDWRSLDVENENWNILWASLKEVGWTYVFGTGVIEAWYILPGFKASNSQPGLQKFGSKESVRKYLKYILDEHNLGSNNRKHKSKILPTREIEFESQAFVWNPNIRSHDKMENWWLSESRKKRPIKKTKMYGMDSSSVEESSEGDENNNSRQIGHGNDQSYSSMKKMQRNMKENERMTYESAKKHSRYDDSKYSHSKIQRTRSDDDITSDDERANQGISRISIGNYQPTPRNSSAKYRSSSPDRRKTCLPPHLRGDSYVSSTDSRKSSKYSDNYENIKIQYKSRVFEGLNFIVTGFFLDDKKRIESLLEQHRGKIVEEMPLPSYFHNRSSTSEQSYIFIGHPTGFRRPKNLLALTFGCPVVHELWIKRSIELNRREPFDNYILPSGTSSLHTCAAFPSADNKANKNLFKGIKFLNFADISLRNVIESAGGSIVEPSKELLEDIQLCRRDLVHSWVQYILLDSYSYRQTVIHHLEVNDERHNPSSSSSNKKRPHGSMSTAAPSDLLTDEAFSAIQSCLRRNSAIGVSAYGINIVSVEWLVNCIILSKVISAYEKDVFQMPKEPKTKPHVHKISASPGMKERYVLDDIIRYKYTDPFLVSKKQKENRHNNRKTTADEGFRYGRIISFYQPSIAEDMQVKLLPLEVVPVDFSDMDDSDISPEFLTKYNALFGTSNQSRKNDHKKTQGSSNLKALTINFDNDFSDDYHVTISADDIVSKVILLNRKSYRALEYAWKDDDIFCVSSEWEEQENDMDDNMSQSSNYKYQRLASQDY